jgi:hypothetical protein
MRDFRDAKAMAHTLRDALKLKAVETTHGECLELIAKAFGYDNWNILSAKIEAAQSPGPAAPAPSPKADDPAAQTMISCTFCGKPRHERRVVIAGPSSTYICNECVDLCNDVVDDYDDRIILDLLKADEESGKQAYPALFEFLRGRPAEEMAYYVERGRKGAERHRLALHCIQRRLAMRDGEVPAKGDILASARFAYLKDQTRENLLVLQQQAERELKRYEAALRIAATVPDGREQQD